MSLQATLMVSTGCRRSCLEVDTAAPATSPETALDAADSDCSEASLLSPTAGGITAAATASVWEAALPANEGRSPASKKKEGSTLNSASQSTSSKRSSGGRRNCRKVCLVVLQ